MRTCATASIVAILGIPLVVTFAACASGSQTNGTTPDKTPTTEAKKDQPAEVRKDEPKTDAPSQTATTEPKAVTTAAPAKAEPTTAAECAQLPPQALDEPAAGVVMNNAQTAADAGRSDRFTPVNDLIKMRRPSYRCCFDIWAKTHAKQPIKILFGFELSPDGTVKSTSIKKEESSAAASELEPCMAEVTKTISFPKSPSGRDTRFTYPFDFKPR